MAKGKKTGTAPGKKANPIRSGFDGPWDSKLRSGAKTAIGNAGRHAGWAAADNLRPKTGKTTGGSKTRGAGRTPRNKGGSGGNPGKK